MYTHQIRKAGNGGFVSIAEAEDRDEYLSTHPGSVYLGMLTYQVTGYQKRPGPLIGQGD